MTVRHFPMGARVTFMGHDAHGEPVSLEGLVSGEPWTAQGALLGPAVTHVPVWCPARDTTVYVAASNVMDVTP